MKDNKGANKVVMIINGYTFVPDRSNQLKP